MTNLFHNVLDASVSGSIVITAVLILRLALRKTPRKFLCLLWLLAVVRLLMPFEIQSNLSLQPEIPPAAQIQTAPAPVRLDTPDMPPVGAPAPQTTAPVFTAAADTAPAAEAAPLPEAAPSEPDRDPMDLIPWLWLAVACCFGVYTIFAYVALKVQVRDAIRISGGWESDRIDTAFILGFIRPKIYIPMGLPLSMRKHILAHERTHLEKGDHWLKMAGFIALSIHWFNPLVWVAYILMCKDIEMACDERVVQFMELEDRKRYSAALLTCSARRSHFSGCPVAFGEVSVKERIKRVLNYRKPGFWISLLGVAAVAFVAVCLLTSPVEEKKGPGTEEEPGAAETIAVETGPAAQLFRQDMTQEEILTAIREGLRELRSRESYRAEGESYTESGGTVIDDGTYLRLCHGTNYLALLDWNGNTVGSSLYFEGISADNWGDAWVLYDRDKADEPEHYWLKQFDIDETQVQTAAVESGDTLTVRGILEDYDTDTLMDLTFTFQEDGTLAALRREWTEVYEEGVETLRVERYTMVEESAQAIYDQIKAEAETAMTAEELDAFRIKAQQVTEVPSNKTSYDKDFMLGSGQMGWQMAEGEWFFKFGAENVTPTGATLVVEYSGPYGDNTIASGTVEAGDTYFIERLENDVWVEVPAKQTAFQTIPKKTLATGNSQSINWEANYGSLDGGFYRIGNYYTFTSGSITDTQVCYAKFRIYDPNQEALLSQARAAIEELKNRSSYHLYTIDWGLSMGGEIQMQDELWKSGPDQLRYSKRSEKDQPATLSGSLWRDGVYYGLEWEGEPVTSPVSSWWKGVDGYMNNSNFSMWAWDFEWYDANVELVYKEGNTIHIQENYDFDDRYECTEIILTLDNSGKLSAMTKQYLTSRTGAEGDKQVSHELAVFDATEQEIAEAIAAQNVTTPMAFSYAEDIQATPDAQVTQFKNTTISPITTCDQSVARADKECTLPRILDFDNGYLQTKVYRDEAEKVWKVELYWWQHDTAQTVWMNDDGQTLRMVTVE